MLQRIQPPSIFFRNVFGDDIAQLLNQGQLAVRDSGATPAMCSSIRQAECEIISTASESITNSMPSNEILERQHLFHVLLQPDQVILQEKINPEALTRHIVFVDSLPPQKSSTDRNPFRGTIHKIAIEILRSLVGIGSRTFCRIDLKKAIGHG